MLWRSKNTIKLILCFCLFKLHLYLSDWLFSHEIEIQNFPHSFCYYMLKKGNLNLFPLIMLVSTFSHLDRVCFSIYLSISVALIICDLIILVFWPMNKQLMWFQINYPVYVCSTKQPGISVSLSSLLKARERKRTNSTG